MGRDAHSLMLSIQHFPLPTTASPTLHFALKNGFEEAVVACGMPTPSKFPSLDSCQKKFLWTHKGAALAPHLVVGLLLQVGDTIALGLESTGFRLTLCCR